MSKHLHVCTVRIVALRGNPSALCFWLRAKVSGIRVRKIRYPRTYLKMQLHLECVEVSLYRVEVTVWDRCVKCRVRVTRRGPGYGRHSLTAAGGANKTLSSL